MTNLFVRRYQYLTAITLLVGLLSISACGGGGGDGGGVNTTSYPITDNSFIKYQGGEILIYNASLQGSECSGCTMLDVTGTETTYIYSGYTFDSMPGISFYKRVTEVFMNDTTVSTNDFFFYDGNNNLIHYVTGNKNYWTNQSNPAEGSLAFPNTITAGNSWSNNPLYLVYDNDKYFEGTMTYTVIKKETISVPFGSVEAYKITYSGTFDERGDYNTDDLDVTGTVWVHPDIGIVKQSEYIEGSGLGFHPSYLYEKELTDINWDAIQQ